MSDTRKVNPAYAADVDEMILDYMAYNTATKFLTAFENRDSKDRRKHADSFALQLNMLDAFITTYKTIHQGLRFSSDVSENLDIKIRLLEFMLGLGTSSLSRGPYQGITKSRILFDGTEFPGQDHTPGIGAGPAQLYYDTDLTSLLPDFMYISACVADILNQDPSQLWMELAAELMLHSTVVAAVACAPPDRTVADGSFQKAAQRHFSWRYLPADSEKKHKYEHKDCPWKSPAMELDDAHDGWCWSLRYNATRRDEATTGAGISHEDLDLINDMFRSRETDLEEENSEIPGWDAVRNRFKTYYDTKVILKPSDGDAMDTSPPQQTLEMTELIVDYPLPKLISRVLELCETLWPLLGIPVLVELEQGRLKSLGLSEKETADLKKRVGLK